MLLRQVAEKDGYRFGKVSTTYHYHHTTDNPMYESDEEKKGSRFVFEEPRMEILNNENWEKRQEDFRKAVVKYLDPEFIYPRDDQELLSTLMKLDMEWVKKTNMKWYKALVESGLVEYDLAEYRLVQYKEKKSIIGKLGSMAGNTITFLAAIKNAFIDYIRHIKASLG